MLFAGLGLWYGRFAYSNFAGVPVFYQSAFGPAVMVAAGRGFQNPMPAPGSPLAEFLAQRRPSLEPSQVVPERVVEPDQLQYATRYLLLAVGYWWRVAGISWSNVADVAGALHALAVVASYLIFRLWLSPLPSIVGALFMCSSTVQLSQVPHIRDYSKSPFILAAIACAVILAVRPLTTRALLLTAGVAGLIIGVGLGFKMDVALMAPMTLGALILFRGRRPWTEIREKGSAAAVFILALLVSAAPVLYRLSSGGSNAVHVMLLGYADQFDVSLGIDPSVYGFVPFYNDEYMRAIVSAHGDAAGHSMTMPSLAYDRASQQLWFDLMRHFPADVFARALAAAESILNLAFVNPAPSFLRRPLPAQEDVLAVYSRLHRWNGWGTALGALLVVAASWGSLRQALLAVSLLLVLAGAPSLQFDIRHYFHLQVIPVLALLVLAYAMATMPFRLARVLRYRSQGERNKGRGRLPSVPARLVGATAIPALLIMLPLGGLRAYQANHVRSWLAAFLERPGTVVHAEFVRESDNLWLARWPGMAGSLKGSLLSGYYLVAFDSDGPAAPIVVGLRYRSTSDFTSFSRLVSVDSVPGIARLGFAVFGEPGGWQFEGMELGENLKRRLAGIYAMNAGPAGLPLDLKLPADWASRPLYQRLVNERRPTRDAASARMRLVVAGNASSAEQVAWLNRLWSESFSPDPHLVDVMYAKTLTVASTGITMDGIVDTDSSYLVQFKPAYLGAGGALVAQGLLNEGGLAIGMLKDGAWDSQLSVQRRGQFVAVVVVKDAGVYVPIVTNAMPPGERRNRFVITRFGVANAEASLAVPDSGERDVR